MVNAVRSRSATGNRVTGLIDTLAVGQPATVFSNDFSLDSNDNSTGAVTGPTMTNVALNASKDAWTNQITVAVWHKFVANGQQSAPDGFDGICNASNTWNALNQGWGMYWSSSSAVTFFINGFNTNFANVGSITSTDWNFFVGVYDGTLGSNNVKIYANATLGGTQDNFTGNITGLSNDVEIGKTANTMNGGGTSDFTPGRYDEFAVWQGALTQTEVTEIYKAGVAGFRYNSNTGLYTSADDLVLWWRCGDGDTLDLADGILDASGNSNHGTSSDMTIVNDVAGGGV